jgi:transcriptional regulator with XRE-family HTH domain
VNDRLTAVAPSPTSVGARLRALRRARRLTLREIADRTDLSESFLSQLEREQSGASVASLQRIAGALGVAVSDLFSTDGAERPRVLRRGARQLVAFGELAHKALLTPKPFESLEVVVAEFRAGGSTGDEPYRHGDSEELLLVLEGAVELVLGEERHRLERGDCAHYRSSTPHRVSNPGPEPAEVLYVVSPPSY